MKYLKYFKKDADYQQFINGEGDKIFLPNVSVCEENDNIGFFPYVYRNEFSGIINATSTSTNYRLFSGGTVGMDNVKTMKIDDVEITPVSSTTFTTTGEHTYEVELNEPMTNAKNMFSYCSGLTSLDLSTWDTSNVTDMTYMFYQCSGLTSLDLSKWDTSKVTTMYYMFNGCTNLTSLDSISNWDTGKVTNMSYMFYGCSGLTSLDLSEWDTSNVTNMSYMFYQCSGLTSLDLSNWDTSNVTDMRYMFRGCTNLTSLDLSNWDISKVTTMYYMFSYCSNLTEVRMGGNPNSLTNVSYMFNGITTNGTFYYNPSYNYSKIIAALPRTWTALPLYENIQCTELIITGKNVSGQATSTPITYTATLTANNTIDGSVATWTETGTGISSEFGQNPSETESRQVEVSFTYEGMTATTTITQGTRYGSLGLGVYNVAKSYSPICLVYNGITNISEMYIDEESINPVSAYTFSTKGNHNVDMVLKDNTTSMYNMFYSCSGLTSLDLSNWDTSNVTEMYNMFGSCSGLTSLDLSNWDTSNVTDMSYMFQYCSKLTSLDGISNWDTSKVTYMIGMFSGCTKLTSLDLSNWDTSNVTMMTNMFSRCSSLTSLDLSNWDLSSLSSSAYTRNMFSGCTNLTELKMNNWKLPTWGFHFCSAGTSSIKVASLDFSDWDTSNVTNMSNMFRSCFNITSVDLTNWDISKVTTMYQMFNNCPYLTEVRMGGNPSKVTNVTDMFDNIDTNGIFYYNPSYDYSKIIAVLPKTWIALPLYENIQCTELIITAEDVSGQATSSLITYTATLTGNNVIDGSVVTWTKTDTGLSSEFEQNLSETDRQVEVSFTYYGMTKTATITQNTWNDGLVLGLYNASTLNSAVPLVYGIKNISEMYIDEVSIKPVSAYTFGTTGKHNVHMRLKGNTTNMSNLFYNSSGLTSIELSEWDTSQVTDMSNMFNYCQFLYTIYGIKGWDTSNVTDMSNMFKTCSRLTPLDLSEWDTSNVTNMSGMFNGCSSLISLDSIKDWDVSNVTEMYNMFNGCSSLISLDSIKDWDVSNVTNMYYMFNNCKSLTSLDSIKDWDTSNVTNMSSMFSYCNKLTSLDLTNWDISKVGNMSYMFQYCTNLTEVRMGGNPSSLTSVGSMFSGITTTGTFYYNSAYDYSKIIAVLPSTWKAVPMAENIQCTELTITAEDVSGRATSTPITYTATLTGNSIGDGSVITWTKTDTGLSSEFEQNLSETDSRQVEVSFTYYGMTKTATITQNTWNDSIGLGVYTAGTTNSPVRLVYSGTNISEMYIDDESINPVSDYTFDTTGNHNVHMGLKGNTTNMNGMFYGCSGLISLDLSEWDTSNVTSMYYMFYNCPKLTSLDLSNWDTSNVTNMSSMFYRCSKLTSVDLTNCDISKVTTMYYMFGDCPNLTEVRMGGNPNSLTNVSYMFNSVTTNGIFYYNPSYNYSKIIAALPSTWIAVPLCENIQCTELVITGEDVSGRATSTPITYTATLTGNSISDGSVITWTETGTGISSEFEQNPSETDSRQVEVSFTYEGITKTTTITQDTWNGSLGLGVCKAISTISSVSLVSGLTNISEMYIDEVSIKPVSNYTFGTTGNHNVDIRLKDNTTNMYRMFNYCGGLTSLDLSEWDTSNVTDMTYMFYYCSGLTSIDLSEWDTSSVTKMSNMFQGCSKLTSLDSIKDWDTSNVTMMTNMFNYCSGLTSLDLNGWDISKVTIMNNMFSYCSNLTEVKMGGNPSSLTSVGSMFSGITTTGTFYYNPQYDYSKIIATLPSTWIAKSYANNKQCTELVITGKDVSGRATSTPITYAAAFTGNSIIDGSVITWSETGTVISSEFEQNLSETDSRQVEISFTYEGKTATTTITQDTWNGSLGLGVYDATTFYFPERLIYSGLTNISEMYIDEESINPVSAYTFGTTGNHNVDMRLKDNTTDMSNMFYYCSGLTSLDLSNWDTSNVTDMKQMFYYCTGLTSLDLSEWDTSNVTNMSNMFYYCPRLTSLDLSDWDTSNVTNMQVMFGRCSGLTSLDLSNWDLSSISSSTYTQNMFSGCTNLTELKMNNWKLPSYGFNFYNTKISSTKVTSLDLSNWDTSNVTNMGYMFDDCYSLTSLDLSDWDTSNVTNMTNMFYFCSKLTSLDLSDWDTSKVTTMYSMFEYSSGLTSLDLSGWDLSSISDYRYMFSGCTNLTELKMDNWKLPSYGFNFHSACTYATKVTSLDSIKDWDTSNVTNMSNMFYYCPRLTSLDLSDWDTSNVTSMQRMFIYCSGLTSLDLSNWDISKVTSMDYMFQSCTNLTEVKMGGNPSSLTNVSSMFYDVTTNGTFYYNPSYDYSKIIAVLPSTWKAVPMAENIQCTGLVITGEDVSGRATSTPITYTATLTGNSIFDSSVATWAESGTGISSEFEQNLSETESRQVEVSFTYEGMTATTTITQDTWNGSLGLGVYDADSTSSPLRLIYSGLTNISEMYIDEESINPVSAYTFGTTGNHNVDMRLKDNTTDMSNMFYYCSGLTSLDLSNWDTSNVTDMKQMFYYCTGLTSVDLTNWDTSNVTNMSYMFYQCSGLTSLDLSKWDISKVTNMNFMFDRCTNLTEVRMGGNPSSLTSVGSMFSGITTTGTFYYNPAYDYSKIIAVLPSTWTALPLYENIQCIELTITAEDVSGRATSTPITYTATLTGNSIGDGSVVTWTTTGTGISSEFEQNLSETESRQVEVSFTYEGMTATTTITQGVWVNQNYSIGLNSQWQLSTSISNPDSSTYEGVYESFSNKGKDNTAAIMYIDIFGYETFKLYVRSYAESSYDYVVVSNLDCTLTNGTTSGSNVKMTTSGKQNSGTAIGNYTLVEFTGIDGGEHRISVMYRKDSSAASGDDRGYLLIPKNQ